MKRFLFLTIFVLYISCDSPQRTRMPSFNSFDENDALPGVQQVVDGEKTSEGGEDDDTVQTEPGFDKCSLAFNHYGGTQIGYFGLCQSTLNKSTFKLKMAKTDKNVGTCFIPLHVLDNGNSFKVGIAECVHNEANKIYDMILTKDRSEEINGVMVIKYDNPPTTMPLSSYMQCMNAKNDYIISKPGCQYSSACLADADAYAQYICSQFKATYSAFYVQLAF